MNNKAETTKENALALLGAIYSSGRMEYYSDYRALFDAIFDIPSLPQFQWIPVSERLPENEHKVYWVCTDTGYQCECRWTNVNPIWTDLTTDWHWNIFDTPQYTKVVAWMPLPKAYEVTE